MFYLAAVQKVPRVPQIDTGGLWLPACKESLRDSSQPSRIMLSPFVLESVTFGFGEFVIAAFKTLCKI